MYNSTILEGLKVQQYMGHVAFIVEGFFMLAGNGLIVLTVLTNKLMRKKEMLLMVGLALSDGCSGIGVLCGGVRRLHLTLSGTDQDLQTSWECLLKLPTIFYITGAQATALMMLLVSVDRLVAVSHFSTYTALTGVYYKRLLGGLGMFSLLTTVVAFASSYLDGGSHTAKWPNLCLSTWAIPRWYAISYTIFAACGGLFSVVVMLAVLVVHRLKHTSVVPESNLQAIQRRRQRRMTITIGVISTCTFFFHSIPYILIVMMVVLRVQNSLTGLLSPYAWSLVNLNSIVTIFVLLWRHANFRKAALDLVRCAKHQPPAAANGAA